MGWIGPTIAAAGSVAGNMISSSGQGAANSMNLQIARETDQFNAQQAAIQRNWEEGMADTSMDRRVKDLNRAGLNPALAYQLGGAAVPGGASASGVLPTMQNTKQAFSQLGNQASSAVALEQQRANIDNINAQTAKTNAETSTVLPATVDKIKSETGLNNQQSIQVQRNIAMADIMLKPLANGKSPYEMNAMSQVDINSYQAAIQQSGAQIAQATQAMFIRARNDANFAQAIGASNIASVSDGVFGKFMALFHTAQPMVSTAGQAVQMAKVAGDL